MEPRIKLWVEKDGQLVLSEYRVQLLQLIAETGSRSDAAPPLRRSYPRGRGALRGT